MSSQSLYNVSHEVADVVDAGEYNQELEIKQEQKR